ncbi:hypothetical protein [Agrobacterium tumefaciens]|uniref:hypothetical protein n=1 Tax=Agrobacterium tumefaciens TaxID=358 RepID=UPI0021D1B9D2|nr:hypothetical protein [Agrobacterium tumefaciens]UXS05542.1 hypothetical protein FY156_28850 [Agrobacterium tumefaciens]
MFRGQYELVELLAFAAAQSIDAVQDKHDFRKTQRAHAELSADALDLDMTHYFEATAETYFSQITCDGIEAVLSDIKGPDFASDLARMKKAEAAAYAEVQAKGTGWLPSPLRSAIRTTDERATGVQSLSDEDLENDQDHSYVADDMAGEYEETGSVSYPEAAERVQSSPVAVPPTATGILQQNVFAAVGITETS